MLLRKIEERGMTNVACYKKANVDKKLFSNIKNTPDYKQKKNTALAFAIALKMTIEETRDLLKLFKVARDATFDISKSSIMSSQVKDKHIEWRI